jgi:hypothetical protein
MANFSLESLEGLPVSKLSLLREVVSVGLQGFGFDPSPGYIISCRWRILQEARPFRILFGLCGVHQAKANTRRILGIRTKAFVARFTPSRVLQISDFNLVDCSTSGMMPVCKLIIMCLRGP